MRCDHDIPHGPETISGIEGLTIAEVLRMTQYDTNELAKRMKIQIDAAIKGDRLKPNEGMRLLADYEKGMADHTYMTADRRT